MMSYSRSFSGPDFVHAASRKLIKKPYELGSDKDDAPAPDSEGNLVASNARSQRLFCHSQECGGSSNIEKNSVDSSAPQTASRFFGGWFASHGFRSSPLKHDWHFFLCLTSTTASCRPPRARHAQ